MSLKHRNLVAYLLILLASAGWLLGQELMLDVSLDHVAGTTHPLLQSTMVRDTEVSFTTEGSINTEDSLESSLAHSLISPSESLSSPAESLSSSPRQDSVKFSEKTWGFLLCVIAAVCGFLAIFLFGQQSPILGPDGFLFLIGLAGASHCQAYNSQMLSDTLERLLSQLQDHFATKILVGCILLAALRTLWGWVRTRFSSSWLFLRRMVKKIPHPQVALLLLILWILLSAGNIGYQLLWATHYRILYPIPFWSMIVTSGCGIFCLWQYGTDLRHLQKQLTHFQNGHSIAVSDGIFAPTETQLLTIQAQHEEAIQTAVTSERFKVDLIANVSHDLRTPLTSILGYSELLQKEALSPEGQEQLRQLHQKAGYMSDLVESLFELTKVSSGVIVARQEEIDLIRLLEQTIGLFDDQLTHAGLTVRRNYCADSILILTDGTRMHQVFANLLSNAIKYALTGTRIYVEVREQQEQYLVRMVNIASYEMDFSPEEILQRFARGDKARSTKGSGLGLAIAQTYTDSVGGTFRIAIDGDQFSALVTLPKNEHASTDI